MADNYERVKEIILSKIKTGEKNAVSSRELQKTAMIKERTLRKIIHEMRRDGFFICSTMKNGGGYFFSENDEELKTFVDSMSKRGRSVFASVTAARRELKKPEQ